MPWSDYDPSVRQISGLIAFAAGERYGTAQTASLLKLSAEAAGIPTSFATYRDTFRLYSVYSRAAQGMAEFAAAFDTFQRTGQDQGITGTMLNPLPWSPSPGDWNIGQGVTARVEYTVETPEGPLSSWFTLGFTRPQLTTVGALIDEAQLTLETSGTESPPLDASLTGNVELSWTQ